MAQVELKSSYVLVIESIGTATPVVSKVLADGFGLPQDLLVKKLYNTPSVLFDQVDEEVAHKAGDLLKTLGLDVRIQSSEEPLPATPELYDIGVYIHDVSYLPRICNQLAEFHGCEQKDALNLLLIEPSIVLGGVSAATAAALSKRLDAEVFFSNPKEDLYTLVLTKPDSILVQQIQYLLNNAGIQHNLKDNPVVKDLTYKTGQDIWRRHHNAGNLQLLNQSHQRYEIVLEEVDTTVAGWRESLVSLTGMPEEIVNEVVASLPMQLDESVNSRELADKLRAYHDAGLLCKANLIYVTKHQLVVEEMEDLEKTRKVLSQFVAETDLPKSKAAWVCQTPMTRLMARYAVAQLESIGCTAGFNEYENGKH